LKENRESRRSDKVRKRLKNESKAWISQASSRLTEPDQLSKNITPDEERPVLSSDSQAQKQNHFFRIGWRLLSFLLTAAFAYGLYFLWTAPNFRISSITISGLQHIPQQQVLEQLELSGNRIYLINTQEVQETLNRTYPELWNITIQLIMPNEVSIRLIERQPMIAWNFDELNLWIDAQGFLIPARNLELDLLTINANALPTYQLSTSQYDEPISQDESNGNIIKDKPAIKPEFQHDLFFAFPKQITPNLLTAILQLNAWMPDEKELLYESTRGVGWKDARGWNVFIGSKLENINDKMLMYETIIRKLDEEGIKPAMVSVEFLHAPYYRLEN